MILRKSDPYGRFINPILITIDFYDFISPFTLLSVVFSTNFSMLGNVIKHCLSCLTDYIKVIMIYLDRIQHSQTSGPHSRSCFRRAKLLLGEILVQKLGRQLCCKLLLVITGRLYHLLLHRKSTSAWSGSDFCSKHWVPAMKARYNNHVKILPDKTVDTDINGGSPDRHFFKYMRTFYENSQHNQIARQLYG